MRTALVTGATGFTGKYMVNALARLGYRVFGIGVGSPSTEDWVTCDLTHKADAKHAIRGIATDVVVHLAGLAFVAENNPEDFYRVNLLGTLNLLEALAECKRTPRKVVIASSANIYGSSAVELTEDTCPAPTNHYAASKCAMELMAKLWFDRMPIVITRPFNYTGPGQDEKFVIPKIVAHYRRRERSIKLGNTSVQRDFSDVEEVVEAYLRLLESDVRSEVVNICSGKAVSIASILGEMNTIAGYKMQVEADPALFRENDIKVLVGSNRKLFDLTGFVPSRPIQETVRRMYFA